MKTNKQRIIDFLKMYEYNHHIKPINAYGNCNLTEEGLKSLLSNFMAEMEPESKDELREPIENALYATGRFVPEVCSDLTDGILEYIDDYLHKSK
jgi:hypothetical protein